jgi:2-polyprenyl-6-methoxyphenol hydroxylase-like FAD-dependent oxidoreductase
VPPEFRRDLVFCTALYGHELGVFRAYGFRPEDAADLAAEAAQPLSQKFTNVVLRRRAEELGTDIATGCELIDLTQSDTGVTAEVVPAEGGEPHLIRSRYLVGCDGGKSTVVRAAGIGRSGAGAYGKHIQVVVGCPDLLSGLAISPGAFYIVFSAAVGGLLVPSDVDEFNVHIAGFGAEEDTSALDLESIARALLGRDLPLEIKAVSPYLVHELVADTYRAGRVLIAGDAAHLFCPYGGFNMNTGMSDAANLGWKLAACVQGWGGDALLDSYTDERRPLALENSSQATYNVNTLNRAVGEALRLGIPEDETTAAESERRRIGQRLYEMTKREWNTAGVSLDQRYTDSGVVVDDGSDVPAWRPDAYAPAAKPGHRLPHVRLRDGSPLYDRLGAGFTLLDLDADADGAGLVEAAARRGVPLTVARLENSEARELYAAPLVLVRPDQHVAWRGSAVPEDPTSLIDTVRGALPVRAPSLSLTGGRR